MRTTSLAGAKAHLSELVDQAEHKKRRILILRHGKPAAAIVPVEVAKGEPRRVRARSAKEARELFAAAARCGTPDFGAVADLLRGRR